MRTRQDLIEIFSSFVQFEGDRASHWLSDPRLRRHMQRCCEAAASPGPKNWPERSWAIHWHQQWQSQLPQNSGQKMAYAHLLAYVQEACYWVAYKASSRFTSAQYGVSDCFQLAIAQLEKVLTGFDPAQGFELKNYASTTFSSLIRDYLRQRQETDICTNWSLLRKVSQKRLVAALQAQGLQTEIEPYVLAWSAYKLIYVPTTGTATRRLAGPESEVWAAIAQYYNTERHHLSSAAAASPAQLEAWMVAAAKAVRSYLYPGALSMNATLPGQDGGEFIDTFSDDTQPLPMHALMAEEAEQQQQQNYQQLADRLTATVAKLDSASQQLLQLYYSSALTQKEIAAQMGIQQYSISRKLSRIRKALLLELSQWAQATALHTSLSPDLLKHTSAALEEWLAAHYQALEPDQ